MEVSMKSNQSVQFRSSALAKCREVLDQVAVLLPFKGDYEIIVNAILASKCEFKEAAGLLAIREMYLKPVTAQDESVLVELNKTSMEVCREYRNSLSKKFQLKPTPSIVANALILGSTIDAEKVAKYIIETFTNPINFQQSIDELNEVGANS